MTYHNPDLERSVLGACMLDTPCAVLVFDTIDPEDFYLASHRKIAELIHNLLSKNKPTDMLSVIEEARSARVLEEVGGASCISGLPDYADIAGAEHHAAKILEFSISRGLSLTMDRCQSMIANRTDNGDVMDEMQHGLTEAARIKKKPVKIGEAAARVTQIAKAVANNQAQVSGLNTGLPSIDRVLGGMRDGGVYVLQGETKAGKSILGWQISHHVAVRGKSVLFVSLEMSEDELSERAVASEAYVSINHYRQGMLSRHQWGQVDVANNSLEDLNLWIDTNCRTPFDIRTRARLMQLNDNIDFICIDYLQMLIAPRHRQQVRSRADEVQALSYDILDIARDINVPVLCLVQENDDGRIRESKTLEQHCKALIRIIVDPDPEKQQYRNIEIKLNRHGPTARGDNAISTELVGSCARFIDLASRKDMKHD